MGRASGSADYKAATGGRAEWRVTRCSARVSDPAEGLTEGFQCVRETFARQGRAVGRPHHNVGFVRLESRTYFLVVLTRLPSL